MDIIGIEVGNSRIKFGLFKNGRLSEIYTGSSEVKRPPGIPAGWKKIKPAYIGLASVVPSINGSIRKNFSAAYGKDVLVIKYSDCRIPMGIRNPEKAGIDRILNCMAALELFGSPVIVVDIGTAITVDAATCKGGFAGGAIIPGEKLWTQSLKKTALIKEFKTTRAHFPGKDTGEAICAGKVYGIPGAINGILTGALKKYPSARVILTGGGSARFKKSILCRTTVRKYLTIEGIGLVLYERAGNFRK